MYEILKTFNSIFEKNKFKNYEWKKKITNKNLKDVKYGKFPFLRCTKIKIKI